MTPPYSRMAQSSSMEVRCLLRRCWAGRESKPRTARSCWSSVVTGPPGCGFRSVARNARSAQPLVCIRRRLRDAEEVAVGRARSVVVDHGHLVAPDVALHAHVESPAHLGLAVRLVEHLLELRRAVGPAVPDAGRGAELGPELLRLHDRVLARDGVVLDPGV